MTTFADFYKAQAAGGTQLPPAPPVTKVTLPSIQAAAQQKSANESPLNWLMDIVSRPLFGVTNAVSGAIDTGVNVGHDVATGNGGQAALDSVAAVPKLAGDFLAGLINPNNDKAMKRSFSDVIEQSTDKIGKATDPNYVDQQDNVNPVLKGIAGFAGDVLGDPLTWIPGGLIVKGAKAALSGGKALAEGAVDAVKGIRAGEAIAGAAPAVEKAAVKAVDNPLPVEENVFGAAARNPKGQTVPELKPVEQAAKAETPKAETVLKMPEVAQVEDAAKAAEIVPNLRQLFNDSAKLPKMQAEIKSLVSSVGKGATHEIPVDNIGTWFKANKDVKVPNVQLPGEGVSRAFTYGELNRVLNAEKAKAGTSALSARGKAAKNFIEGGYQEYKDATQTTRQTEVLSSLDEFSRRRQENHARVVEALGQPLVKMMAAKRSPQRFDEMMTHIGNALNPETDLHNFYSSHPQLGEAIQSGLGIPMHIKPTPNTIEDLAQAQKVFTEPDTVVADSVARTLGKETPTSKEFRERYPVGQGQTVFNSHVNEIKVGNTWKKLNTFFQYTLYRDLTGEIKKRMTALTGKEKLYGSANARAWRDATLSTADEMVSAAQTFGTKLHIGVQDDLLPITFPEVYKLTEAGFGDSDKALLALYNNGSAVPFTVLMQATHKAVMAGDLKALGRDGVLQLRQEIIDGLKDPKQLTHRKDIPNNLTQRGDGYVFPPNQQKAANAASKRWGGKPATKTEGGAWQAHTGPDVLVEDLADAILKAQPSIAARISDNALMWKNRGLAEAAELSNSQIKHIRELLTDDAYKAQYLHDVAELPKNVAEEASTRGATQEAVGIGTRTAQGAVGDLLENDAKAAVSIDTTAEAKGIEQAVDDGVQKQTDNVMGFDDLTLPPESGAIKPPPKEGPKVAKFDISYTEGRFDHLTKSKLPGVDWAKEHFDHKYGRQDIEPIQAAAKASSALFMEQKTRAAADIAHTWDQETLTASLAALQRGDAPAHLAEPMAAIQKQLSSLFNMTGDKSILSNFFLSTEKDLEHINNVLLYNKTGLEFSYREAKDAAAKFNRVKKPTQQMIATELDKQWRTVSVKDPAEWLVRMANAATTIAEHRAVVGGFVNRFTKAGLFSTEPKPGMVKIVASKDSVFQQLLPKNSYADPELAGQLRQANVLFGESREIEGDIGKWLRENYFPVQNLWKQYMTIFRPGHHVRNFIGDSSVTAVARGAYRFPDSYKDAFKVLGIKNNYSDMDLIDSLKRIEGDTFTLPQGGDITVKGAFRGKPVELSNEAIHQMLTDNGLINTFTHAEDLLTDAELASGVQRATQRLSLDGTGVKRLAAGTSESVAHLGRAAHFIQALKQELSKSGRYHQHGGAKTFDELVQKVANEVRRAHPDGTMLTNFEHKYLRVLIPFYSWFSKTLPFMLEAAARNPARVTAIPKASYNLAVGMGINPDSLTNPFPTDQMFPSFLTEGVMGPQFQGPDGQYVNVNPGFAATDLANTLVNPVRGLAGMISPLIRVPAELLSGSSWQTGSKIKDTSDYLDQNLPVINYLANLTGVSPTGSLVSAAEGKGLDPQAQVAAGNKTGFDQTLTALNWLTGINAQNWSRPNFINYAEIEKRNQAAGGQ